jgi:hypothetical protein
VASVLGTIVSLLDAGSAAAAAVLSGSAVTAAADDSDLVFVDLTSARIDSMVLVVDFAALSSSADDEPSADSTLDAAGVTGVAGSLVASTASPAMARSMVSRAPTSEADAAARDIVEADAA